MDKAHPQSQDGGFVHFLLGNIPGNAGEQREGQHHIKKAAVVADIENGSVSGNVFPAPDDESGPSDVTDTAKSPTYQRFAAAVPETGIELSDDPLNQKDR